MTTSAALASELVAVLDGTPVAHVATAASTSVGSGPRQARLAMDAGPVERVVSADGEGST